MTDRKPVLLLILDGWGLASPESGGPENSAIELSHTPTWRRLWSGEFPRTRLVPHGEAVGLSEGQMGNSEVGHLNLGAGRVVYQDLVAITRMVRDGKLADHGPLGEFLDGVGDGALHFIGLFSDGGVHSHIDHLIGIAEYAAERLSGTGALARGSLNSEGTSRRPGQPLEGFATGEGARATKMYIHAMLDGRDTPPAIAEQFFEYAEPRLPADCRFATLGGRYFGMDRDKRWERTKLHYDAIVGGISGVAVPGRERLAGTEAHPTDWREALRLARKNGETDEFITPTVLDGYQGIAEGDSVLCFNFRADRMRQLVAALSLPDFDGFDRGEYPHVRMFTFTHYRDDFDNPVLIKYDPLPETLAEVCSRHRLTIYKSAETEKYAHVTYFFNGGREEPWPGEDRVLVQSPKVATYDLQPEMSVREVTALLCGHLRARDHDLYVVNYANPDMVGHTGVVPAILKACEAVDECLVQVLDAAGWGSDVAVIVTADHGNCDQLRWPDGTPHTQHSMNDVPVVLVSDPPRELRQPEEWTTGNPPAEAGAHPRYWTLCDVAPTILALLSVAQPESWTGISLLE